MAIHFAIWDGSGHSPIIITIDKKKSIDEYKFRPICPICHSPHISVCSDPQAYGGKPYTCYDGCQNTFRKEDLHWISRFSDYKTLERLHRIVTLGTLDDLFNRD